MKSMRLQMRLKVWRWFTECVRIYWCWTSCFRGGMNGLDLCRLLKTNPALGLPAVVLVTAHGQLRDIEAALAAGADAYRVKPFNFMKLLEIVKRLCEKSAH